MNTKRLQREAIASMRAAIAAFDTDHSIVRQNMYKAHDLFRDHLTEWPEDFYTLYSQMLDIYCAHTPMPTGHYRKTNLRAGGGSFPVQIWVNDTVQPPKPTAAELVARFDALLDAWNTRLATEKAGDSCERRESRQATKKGKHQ